MYTYIYLYLYMYTPTLMVVKKVVKKCCWGVQAVMNQNIRGFTWKNLEQAVLL